MSEIYWFMGKTNKRIYHMMSKKIKNFLAKVPVKVNMEISKNIFMPNDNSILQYGLIKTGQNQQTFLPGLSVINPRAFPTSQPERLPSLNPSSALHVQFQVPPQDYHPFQSV